MGSPKELSLGLLELLETRHSIWDCMKLLEATQKGVCTYYSALTICYSCPVVFSRLTSTNALGSSLYSVSKIIHRHYHLLTIASTGDVLLGSHGDHQSNAATACQDSEECDDTCSHDNMVTILEQIVQFVRPFVSQIHCNRGTLDHMTHLTPVQHGCISL